jgi:hypothetical protein
LIDGAALKTYRLNEILMLIAPYLAEISLVCILIHVFPPNKLQSRSKNSKLYVLRVALSEGTKISLKI